MLANSSKIDPVVWGSRAEVASSHNSTLGLLAKALAMPTFVFAHRLVGQDKHLLYHLNRPDLIIRSLWPRFFFYPFSGNFRGKAILSATVRDQSKLKC